jgi:hypothetical protein
MRRVIENQYSPAETDVSCEIENVKMAEDVQMFRIHSLFNEISNSTKHSFRYLFHFSLFIPELVSETVTRRPVFRRCSVRVSSGIRTVLMFLFFVVFVCPCKQIP